MKELIIDPSIEINDNFENLIIDFKIKLISYKSNKEISKNIYYNIRKFMNKNICDDILKSVYDKFELIEFKKYLKNNK